MMELLQSIQSHFNFFIYIILMLIGLWAMIAKKNYIKKLIGMSIFQTAVILFYVSIGVKDDATIPIITEQDIPHAEELNAKHFGSDTQSNKQPEIRAVAYANPLPHVLMLTAIVVGVATLGVALAVTVRVYREYETIEEDELLSKLESDEH